MGSSSLQTINVPGFLDIELVFYQVYRLITGVDVIGIPEAFFVFWSRLEVVSFLVSALLAVGIAYTMVKIKKIRAEESKELNAGAGGTQRTMEERKNEKWKHILDLSESENPREWRLAILEADILLDELVNKMGYRGDTLGEKLKSIEVSDFTTLNEAWEAHKVRNVIAHEGSDFILTARETRRIIGLYRQVFEEFHYI